jgi:hypothetical protein
MTSYRNQGEYLTLERQDESDTPCAVSCTGGARRLPQGFDVTPGWVHKHSVGYSTLKSNLLDKSHEQL